MTASRKNRSAPPEGKARESRGILNIVIFVFNLPAAAAVLHLFNFPLGAALGVYSFRALLDLPSRSLFR